MVRLKLPNCLHAVAAAALLTVALPAAGALAQATPTAIELDVPTPEECLVEPRAFPFFPEGVGQRAAATPAPLATEPEPPFTNPTGDPASEETVTAVTATVREALACRNGNDFLRAYALFTQDMLVSLFGGPATIDPEIRAAITEEAGPVQRRQRVGLVSVTEVTLLPDGRVGAVVDTASARHLFQDYLFFVLDPASNRWLIDETVPLVTPQRPTHGG